MSDSVVVEVYESQTFDRLYGWRPARDLAWSLKKTLEPCKPLEEITLPGSEWIWASNWRIDKNPGMTDKEGWEYASRISRFKNKNRPAKIDPKWRRARRRVWYRIMRREVGIKSTDVSKVLPKVQLGLSSVHGARVRIEEIARQSPDSIKSDQMLSLVSSVKKNIGDILNIVDDVEKSNLSGASQNHSYGILKKLRNDVLKEEAAIDKALNLDSKRDKNYGSFRKTFTANSSMGNSVMEERNTIIPRSQSFNMKNKTVNNDKGNPFLEKEELINSGQIDLQIESKESPHDLNQNSNFESSSKKNNCKAVKSGTAGAFNTEMFQIEQYNNYGKMGDTEPEDGVFMARSQQETIIAQKLIAVADEATIMQEIIDERSIEIEKIHKGLIEVNEMFKDLAMHVKEQQVHIDLIYGNVDESKKRTEAAFEHIVEANRLHQQGRCIIS